MVFCNVDPTVHEVFRLSKLEPLFTFAEDRAAALKLLGVVLPPDDGRSPDTVEIPSYRPPSRKDGPSRPEGQGPPPLKGRRRKP
jgi:hypothetical protein